ncbi:MAG: hypothetical protein HY812_11555 [Planctomycetes bacterium]|nr:hypothetical protein [Planctomycetota bacterium]
MNDDLTGDFRVNWQIIALTFNIVGFFFILNSLYFKRPKRLLHEYYGIEKQRPLRSIRDHVMNMVQLVIGFVFLILGQFLLIADQLSMTIDDRDSFFGDPSVLTIAAFLIGSMMLVTLVLKVFQIFWTKWSFKRLLTDFYREHSWALQKYPATAKQAGEILGVSHRKEDSVSEYLKRLMAYLEIEGVEGGAAGEPGTGAGPRSAIPPEPSSTATHPATPPRIMS